MLNISCNYVIRGRSKVLWSCGVEKSNCTMCKACLKNKWIIHKTFKELQFFLDFGLDEGLKTLTKHNVFATQKSSVLSTFRHGQYFTYTLQFWFCHLAWTEYKILNNERYRGDFLTNSATGTNMVLTSDLFRFYSFKFSRCWNELKSAGFYDTLRSVIILIV